MHLTSPHYGTGPSHTLSAAIGLLALAVATAGCSAMASNNQQDEAVPDWAVPFTLEAEEVAA